MSIIGTKVRFGSARESLPVVSFPWHALLHRAATTHGNRGDRGDRGETATTSMPFPPIDNGQLSSQVQARWGSEGKLYG
eukprot:CAMPEP_0182573226 /NCGR_PEP_ID=MMETSP1324-20130603/18984_1 /TAXON_ID=236786 /ORGANISM="Florenciella sp., Strain RCC1587" /LENGTH=78 /DNA_ID=CAMNT_0024788299 /DNA_START=19 /DNA_END=253 /DNA_ORIENTATION=+